MPSCRTIVALTLLAFFSAGSPAAAQRLKFQFFDEVNGLSYAGIGSLAQDRAGFLYAGTEIGIYRFDGFRFELLGAKDGLPASGEVESVNAAADGGLWSVFPDRVYFTGQGDSASAPLEARRRDDYAHRAAVLGDDLLLVRNRVLLRIHRNEAHGLSVSRYIPAEALAHDPKWSALRDGVDSVFVEHGVVWLGCGEAICRLGEDGAVRLGASVGLPADHWSALLRDHEGTLWVRSAGRIASLPHGASRFAVIDVPGGAGRFAGEPGRLGLAEDAAGRVVTQSANGLLFHAGGGWAVFDHDPAISYAGVTAMLVDRENSLWIGINGRGVARIVGPGSFENWTRAQGLSDDLVWNARRDGAGTLWVANDLAVDALAEPTRKPLPPTPPGPGARPPLMHYPFRAFALAKTAGGRLWIARQDGELIRRDPRSGADEVIAHLGPIRVMAADPAGPLWIGTVRGLVRIDRPDDPQPPAPIEIATVTGRIFAIAFDRGGDPWVLTEKTLYHRDHSQQWHPVLQTDPEGGYPTRTMVFAPDGTLWLGSFATGVLRLRLDHDAIVSQDRAPSQNLISQDVELLHRDPGGRVWVGTDHGLDVTDGRNWRHLDEQDGLAANDVNENAAFSDTDGTSWFGTVGGLSHFTGISGLFCNVALHPVITAISVGPRALSQAEIRHGRLSLVWSGDPLVIGFSALDFRFAETIRFRYRLRGVDHNWVETASREVHYPNPPPGKLLFEVMAVDPLHRATSQPVTFTINLRAPWWRAWPFYAAAAGSLAGLLVLLWRLRVRYLLARQRQLEALVAERTREIEEARVILLRQATFDGLTGLLNRSAILQDLRSAIEGRQYPGMPLGLALIDLDHFKKINDAFGHLGGDAVLSEVGRRLAASTRETDKAGRYGGEELLVLLPGLKPDAYEPVEMLRAAVFAEPFLFEGQEIRMTCSMGVTWLRPGDDVTAMIRRADAALYAAKRAGRDCVVFDPPRGAPRQPSGGGAGPAA